jgi:hypothetical protein
VRRTGGRSPKARKARQIIRRLARWIGADGNPLRRRVDRVEIAARVLLLAAFFSVAPLLVPLAGNLASSYGMRQVRQERSWRMVDAVLRRSAPPQTYGYGSMTTYWVPARWTAPDGAARSGLVPIKAGTTQGSVAHIWVDRTGDVTGRSPMTTGLVSSRAVLARIGTVAGLALALLALAGLLRALLDRRRMTCWAMEWAAFGPRWSARRWPRS